MSQNLSYFFLLFLLSLAPSLFWLFFYFYYSPRFTTSRGVLALLFGGGGTAALASAIIERAVISFLPFEVTAILNQYFFLEPSEKLANLGILALFIFLFIAPIEELIKFVFLYLVARVFPRHLNQIIDGIKFGIVVGLGFAAIENGIYFSPSLASGNISEFTRIFFLRFFMATLSHSLYTGILGYYIGLSHFYRLYRGRFIRNGLIISIFIHGLFNFFLLVNIGFYSVILVVISLLFIMKWYRDRKNIETYIVEGQYELIRPPFFSERPEFESILAKNQVSYAIIKKLRLCPFCLKKKDPSQELCSYCGARLKKGGSSSGPSSPS